MAFLNYHGLQTFKEKENEQIAPVEKISTASKAYAVGERFWFDGNLCKATSAIAAGASIVLGTNCEHSPMSDMKELPGVSSSDNGKVLSVVGGKWTPSEIPSGNLPVVSAADNGKVLGVVNGEWAVTTVGGDDGSIKLNLTYYGLEVVNSLGESYKRGYELKANADQMGKDLDAVPITSTYGSSYWNFIIPIPEGAKHVEYYTYRSGTNYSYGSLFLNQNNVVVGYRSIPTGYAYTARTVIPAGAKYFVYGYSSSSTAAYNVPPYFRFTDDKPEYGITELGLHSRPIFDGVVNSIKNARQITDCTWHAIMNLPRTLIVNGSGTGRNIQGTFTANTEYKGLPYSDPLTVYERRLLCVSTPLEAFITANLHTNSVQGVESQYTDRAGSYYGTCCTGLTAHAYNIPYMYSGNYMKSGDFQPVFTIDNNTDYDELMLGDVLQHDGHCLMVSDIIRDENGVKYIEIAEQTRAGCDDETVTSGPRGGISRRCVCTTAQINSMYNAYNIVRFRYLELPKYIPTAFSPTDEGALLARPDYPLLPYYGNNCLLHQTGSGGPTCRLVIGPTEYNKVVVKKDGEDFDTYTITSSSTYVDVACDTDAAKYSAKLALYDGDTFVRDTKACTWYVTDEATVETSKSGKVVTFTVKTKSEGFYPWFGCVDGTSTTAGYNRMIYSNYTEEMDEQNRHVFTFSISAINTQSPTSYVIGLKSDEYGAWYFTGSC